MHKQNEKIRIMIGVRQMDTIAPKLFTAALESISIHFRMLKWEIKVVKIDGEFITTRYPLC